MEEWGKYKRGHVGRTGKSRISAASDQSDAAGTSPESFLLPRVSEAEVTGIESHPKQPGMYRVAVKLHVEGESDATAAGEDGNRPEAPGDWKHEVDALIAGAVRTSSAERSHTVVTVHEDTLVGMRLLKGRKLSADEWESLRKEEALQETYRTALSMLERKARTSRELAAALKRKGFDAAAIASCLERLQSKKMLDDLHFAKRYAEQKATAQRKGSRLIRQELLQRGIAREDADRALGDLGGEVELDAALASARKKWQQLKGDPKDRKMKLTAFLLRRGFPGGVVREALQRVLADSPHSDRDDLLGFDPDDPEGSAVDWNVTNDPDSEGFD